MSANANQLLGNLTPAVKRPRGAGSVFILGVRITDCVFEEGIERVLRLIHQPAPSSVFFCHWHTLSLAARDPAFRDELNRADLVFGDGTGVRWAARARGVALSANLNGTDLIPTMLSQPNRSNNRYFLLGARPDAIGHAAGFARDAFPGWTLAGHHHGYLEEASSESLIQTINHAEVNLLLVGMGSPMQERWILKNQPRLSPCCCVSVGGLFDHWSGALRRAPVWLRRLGMEWFYLPFQQPRKFRRYFLESPGFLWRMWRAAAAESACQPGRSS